jgi:site-specific DNA-methyltransferase (adenine-specific)
MERYQTDLLDLRLGDCMDLMREMPDNHWDLAIIDPPYGIGEDGLKNHSRCKVAKATKYTPKNWDKSTPSLDYFLELKRVSKNQIVWGANHFIQNIPNCNSSCWIVWDKDNSGDFADCELAFTSFKSAVRKFTWRWNGMLQQDMKNKEQRIHPTQKPVALYNWLLHNYAKPGDRILDTHLGSMSIAIACHYKGFHLTGTELDKDYFTAGVERVKKETAQMELL